MTQEKVFKELAVKGDVLHILDILPQGETGSQRYGCVPCDEDFPIAPGPVTVAKLKKAHPQLDLTTPDGVMWMLVRLPKWGRFEEFCVWLKYESSQTALCFHYDYAQNQEKLIGDTFKWLATDAKDGKAPALFNALCEFEGLGVEG